MRCKNEILFQLKFREKGFGKTKMAGQAIIDRANTVNKDRYEKALSVLMKQ